MRRWLALAGLALLAGCAQAAPTLTPTRALSGPTLAPSPTFMPRFAAEAPLGLGEAGQNNPTAAALAPGGAMPPLSADAAVAGDVRRGVKITAADGALLEGDLYQTGTVRLPGVLLLAESRAMWGEWPAALHSAGFTVLVMDMRPAFSASDVTVMLQALASGEADPARLGVIGAGAGAAAALRGCAVELLCDAAGLLSPSGDPALTDALARYNPRPLFLAASQDDPEAFAMIEALRAAATGQVQFQPFASAGVGAAMLQLRPDLGDLLIAWLKRTLV